jgi:peptidoglycan/LPS O-acetylase OafA/YrhL
MNNQERARFDVLDGMRGIAAVMVMIYHLLSDFGLSGWTQDNHSLVPLKSGQLAVDFFFMLSGFVLIGAYGPMLSRGTAWGEFLLKRAIRLYPMYAIGMIFGLLALGLALLANPDGMQAPLDWGDMTVSVVSSLAMIPDYIGHYGIVLGSTSLAGATFPLNPPGWTLFYELYAGTILVFAARRSNRFLVAIVALSLFALLAATPIAMVALHRPAGFFFFAGGVRDSFGLGLPRMAMSFVIGILLWRWRSAGYLERGPLSWPIGIAPLYVVLIVSLAMPTTLKGAWPLLFLFGVAPLLIIWGARIRLRSPMARRVSEALGWISFPIYCVHYPVGQIAWLLCGAWHLSLWSAFFAGSLLSIAVAALTCRFIEEPIRKRLAQPHHPAVQALG